MIPTTPFTGVKAVLFDLDGTLLDRDRSLLLLLQDQYARFKPLHTVPSATYCRRFIELDKRGYVWKDAVYRQLLKEYDMKLRWEDMLEDYVRSFRHHCVAFPHMTETLQALRSKGCKLAVISNGYGDLQYANIQALGIEPLLDVIVISEWEGIKKPDPDIFLRAMSKLEVKPEEAVYVGDHPTNDVEASCRVGMKGIWKEDLYYPAPARYDAIIRDLSELAHLI